MEVNQHQVHCDLNPQYVLTAVKEEGGFIVMFISSTANLFWDVI